MTHKSKNWKISQSKTMTKSKRPIKGDGEWRKHRNKPQKRYYWKRERQAQKRSTRGRSQDD